MALRSQWRDLISSFVPGSSTNAEGLVTFSARDLVSFLLGCGRCTSRSAAAELGENLRQRDVVRAASASFEGRFTDSVVQWVCRAGEDASSAFSFSPPALLATPSSYVLASTFGKQGTLFVTNRAFVLDRGSNRLYVYNSDKATTPRYYVDFTRSASTIRLLTPGRSVPVSPHEEPTDTDTEGEGEAGRERRGVGGLLAGPTPWGLSIIGQTVRIIAYTGSEKRARLWAAALAAAANGSPCRNTVSHYQQRLSRLPVNPPLLHAPGRPLVPSRALGAPPVSSSSGTLAAQGLAPPPGLARSVRELLGTPHRRLRQLVPPAWAGTYAASLRLDPDLPPECDSSFPWAGVVEEELADETGDAAPQRLLEGFELTLDTYCRVMAPALALGESEGLYSTSGSPSKGGGGGEATSALDLRPLRLLVLEPWRLGRDLGVYSPGQARALLERSAALVPLLPFEDEEAVSFEGAEGEGGRRDPPRDASVSRGLSSAELLHHAFPSHRSPSVSRGLQVYREASRGVGLNREASALKGRGRQGLSAGGRPAVSTPPPPDARLFHAQRGLVQLRLTAILQDFAGGSGGAGRVDVRAGGGHTLTRLGREQVMNEELAASLATKLLPTSPASSWGGGGALTVTTQLAAAVPTATASSADRMPHVQPVCEVHPAPPSSPSGPQLSTSVNAAVVGLEPHVCESWAVRLVQLASTVRRAARGQHTWRERLLSPSRDARGPASPPTRARTSMGSVGSTADFDLGLAAWNRRATGGQGQAEAARKRASSADRYAYGPQGMGVSGGEWPSVETPPHVAVHQRAGAGRHRTLSFTGVDDSGGGSGVARGGRSGAGAQPPSAAASAQSGEVLCAHVKSLMVEQAVAVLSKGHTQAGMLLQFAATALHSAYGMEFAPRLGVLVGVPCDPLAHGPDSDGEGVDEEDAAGMSCARAAGMLREDLQPIVAAATGAVRDWPRTWLTSLGDWGSTGLYMKATPTFEEALGGGTGHGVQSLWRAACRLSRLLTLTDRDFGEIAMAAVQRVLFGTARLRDPVAALYGCAYSADEGVLRLACARLEGISAAQLDLEEALCIDRSVPLAVVTGGGGEGGGAYTLSPLVLHEPAAGGRGVQAGRVLHGVCGPSAPWLPLVAVLPAHLLAASLLGQPTWLLPTASLAHCTNVASADDVGRRACTEERTDRRGSGSGGGQDASVQTARQFPHYPGGTPDRPASQAFFSVVVHLLALLPCLPAPGDKARCLVVVVDVLCQVVTLHRLVAAGGVRGAEDVAKRDLDAAHITADDLLGLLACASVHATNLHPSLSLPVELALVADFAGEDALVEQTGFVLTSLQAALMYIVSDDIAERVACGVCEDRAAQVVVACAACGRQLCGACDDRVHGAGGGAEGHVRRQPNETIHLHRPPPSTASRGSRSRALSSALRLRALSERSPLGAPKRSSRAGSSASGGGGSPRSPRV